MISSSISNTSKQKLMRMFIEELPVLRAKARVSQETLAERIGVSRQTYSGIETGRRELTWTVFLALVAFFQNNESTKSMLENMDGFADGMKESME